MCHVDTNLEHREQDEGTDQIGTSGYSQHQCRNFDEAFAFAEKWRVWNGKSRPEQARITDEENIPGRIINYDYVSSRGDPVPS